MLTPEEKAKALEHYKSELREVVEVSLVQLKKAEILAKKIDRLEGRS